MTLPFESWLSNTAAYAYASNFELPYSQVILIKVSLSIKKVVEVV